MPLAFYTLIRKRFSNLSTRTIPGRLPSTVLTWTQQGASIRDRHADLTITYTGYPSITLPVLQEADIEEKFPYKTILIFFPSSKLHPNRRKRLAKTTVTPRSTVITTTLCAFMSPAIQLHHFRVIRLVAFWVQSHQYTVFVEFGNFTPTRPRVQQIVKPPFHITSSLIIYWLLKAQRKDIRQADLIFVLPADLQHHLKVNHAKVEDRQAFAQVKMGYWNVVQTHIRVGAEKY